jgi:hypothetical protein
MEHAGVDARGTALWRWPVLEDILVYPIGQVARVTGMPVPHPELFKIRRHEVYIIE